MKTINFFSYKGGAGRSTLAFNTIPILANEYYKPTKKSPMIIVDMDIDSCGMSYLLNADKKVTNVNSVQYLLANGCDKRFVKSISDHPFLSKLIPVGTAFGYSDNDAILLLPAKDGQLINSDSTSNYSEKKGSPFIKAFESFLDVCEEMFDIPVVVIDSAVGNTATANVSNESADIIVCCMRPTTQFVNGTHRFLCGLEGKVYSEESGPEDRKSISDGKDIVVVPNVVPRDEIVINNMRYPEYAVRNISSSFPAKFGANSRFNYHFDMFDPKEFGIPAVDRFMWCESILYTSDESLLNDNEKEALKRYHKLADILYNIE